MMRSLVAILSTPRPLLSSASGWWVAKERSGTTLVDQTGNGRNLVAANSPTFGDDGTHQFISLRSASSHSLANATDQLAFDPETGDFTALIVTTPKVTLAFTKIFLSKRSGSALGWNIYNSAGSLQGVVDDDVTTGVTMSNGTLTLNVRYTLALVLSGSSAFIVKNGVAGASVTRPSGSINSTDVLRLQASADQDVYGVAIFKGRALTLGEIANVEAELLAADTV